MQLHSIKQRQPGHPNDQSKSEMLLGLQQTRCPLPSLQFDLIEASTGTRYDMCTTFIETTQAMRNDSSQTLLQHQLCPPLEHLCHHPDPDWSHPPC